ncbi:MAG: hypothetical protein EBZ77_01645, partial [Chitinophagia bacterium]|nr:hypothetical protein [Chitinophagia bacterium]
LLRQLVIIQFNCNQVYMCIAFTIAQVPSPTVDLPHINCFYQLVFGGSEAATALIKTPSEHCFNVFLYFSPILECRLCA